MKHVIRLMLMLLALLPATITYGQNWDPVHHGSGPLMPSINHKSMVQQTNVVKSNTLTNQLTAPAKKGSSMASDVNQKLLKQAFNSAGNKLMNKAPRRLSADNVTGDKIMFMLGYDYNSDSGNIALIDNYFQGGWDASVTEESPGVLKATYMYYYLPVTINVNYDAKTAEMEMGTLATFQWSNTVGSIQYDTTQVVMIVNEDYILNAPNGNLTNIPGTVNDEGSLHFDDGYCYYIIDYCTRTKNGSVSCDTIYFRSPFLRDTYLMTPNGKHQCDAVDEVQGISWPEEVDVYMYQANDTTAIIWNMWAYGNRNMVMYIHEDGTMEFPSLQVGSTNDRINETLHPGIIFHNEFYNYAVELIHENDSDYIDPWSASPVSTLGTMTPTEITWDASILFSRGSYDEGSTWYPTYGIPYFLHNKLTFTDGSEWFENQEEPDSNIVFVDEKVKELCVQNWDTGGDGDLSYTEAAAVTDLGSVFSNNSEITSFDELQYFTGLTTICDSAFYYCRKLTSVTISNSVTLIDNHAFDGCSSLTTIIFGNSVTIIGNLVFQNCSRLTNVTFPNSLTSIGDHAFLSCKGLTEIILPNSVTTIASRAFCYCLGLTSIYIPSSVTSMGENPFAESYGLTEIVVDTNNPNYDSRNDCNAIIETASNRLISGCENTVIPTTVTSIASRAFCSCIGLKGIVIPGSVTSIQYDSFLGCSGLTSIVVENNNPTYDSRDNCNAIIMTASNQLILGCRNTVIPNTVTGIGTYAFHSCKNLTSISMPESVTSIGVYAFSFCSGLTNITIPNSVTNISYGAFSNCSSLTDVYCYISDLSNVTTASSFFFLSSHDYSGRTLHVPAGTMAAYQEDTKWSQFFGNIVEMGDDSIINFVDENVKTLCVQNWDTSGDGELSVSEAAAVTDLGSVFRNNRVITSFDELQYFTGLTSICDSAFYRCSELASLTMPTMVTTIGKLAFDHCSRLNVISIPESVTSICESAFDGCSGLTSLIIPNSVISIGQRAFGSCSSLTNVAIGASVSSIALYAFSSCRELNSITIDSSNPNYDSRDNCNAIIETATNTLIVGCKGTIIPNTVTTIGLAAFNGCSGLNTISIPESVTTIGRLAFWYSGLTEITIPNSVTTIKEYAFEGCSRLKSIFLGTSVESIGQNLFWGCDSLISIVVDSDNPFLDSRDNCNAIIGTRYDVLYDGCKTTVIPNTVKTIGNMAFAGIWALKSIIIPNSVTSINNWAFRACGLKEITIGKSVNHIALYAFESCDNLTDVTCYAVTPPTITYLSFPSEVTSQATLYGPSTSLELYQQANYWRDFTSIEPIVSSGDIDGDGKINISDVTNLINYLLNGDDSDFNIANADLNGDGKISITDVTALINILLSGSN